MSITIYHNPRCSKSRASHQLLTEQPIELTTVEYLKTPPTVTTLTALLQKLDMDAFSLIRKSEAIYKEKFKGKSYSNEEWIDIMVQHPKLIERPIIVKGDKAVIGRPIENVMELLKQ